MTKKRTIKLAIIFSLLLQSFPAFAMDQWKQDDYGWTYQVNGAALSNTWSQLNNQWYHFNTEGYMDIGWITDNNNTYYLSPDGAMLSGTQVIDGQYCSFRTSGELLGPPKPIHIDGLDDNLLREAITQTDLYWSEIEYSVALVNQERERLGLPALIINKDLCNIAGYRNAYINQTNSLDHISSDGTVLGNATATLYFGQTFNVGENLFRYYSRSGKPLDDTALKTAEMGFDTFLASPSHYHNIINSTYQNIGISIFKNTNNTRYFITQLFSRHTIPGY